MARSFRLALCMTLASALPLACSSSNVVPGHAVGTAAHARAISGQYGTLHEFLGGADGATPYTPLILGQDGNFYGTTAGNGGRDFGTVFQLTPESEEQVIHEFSGGSDGAAPMGGLLAGPNGVFYGTTVEGGDMSCETVGCGTVFELIPASGTYQERVLHAFGESARDGLNPYDSLIAGSDGSLYGTTQFGGQHGFDGIAYKLTPSDRGFTYSIIYEFRVRHGGEYPAAGLTIDPSGALYGTASVGGRFDSPGECGEGCGAVFKLTPNGRSYRAQTLYEFRGSPDGAMPRAKLLADGTGAFYGTTSYGGVSPSSGCPSGCGTVFKLTPNGSGYAETVIYRFQPNGDGAVPMSPPIEGPDGTLYGTTEYGGTGGNGTIYSLTPNGSGGFTEQVLFDRFGGRSGTHPFAAVLLGPSDQLFGTASAGGRGCGEQSGCGTVFAYSL
jgi:uncharacterized repeat protein (TIGR03803 family)